MRLVTLSKNCTETNKKTIARSATTTPKRARRTHIFSAGEVRIVKKRVAQTQNRIEEYSPDVNHDDLKKVVMTNRRRIEEK